MPAVGPHLASHRRARVVLDATQLAHHTTLADECADAFWPALGYLAGLRAEARVPVLVGLGGLRTPPTTDDLKAFSAAFGTTGTAALFHMEKVTPEAPDLATALGGGGGERGADLVEDGVASASASASALPGCTGSATAGVGPGVCGEGALRGPAGEEVPVIELSEADLADAWRALDSGASDGGQSDDVEEEAKVDLVALGNPHLSLNECAKVRVRGKETGAEHESQPSHGAPPVLATPRRCRHAIF